MSQTTEAGPVPLIDFRDEHGRRWLVEFTPAVLAEAKGIGLELATAMNHRRGPFLLFDCDKPGMRRTVEALYLACKKQITERGLSPEAFAKVLAHPPTFEVATAALFGALAVAFPTSSGAASLVGTLLTWNAHREKGR